MFFPKYPGHWCPKYPPTTDPFYIQDSFSAMAALLPPPLMKCCSFSRLLLQAHVFHDCSSQVFSLFSDHPALFLSYHVNSFSDHPFLTFVHLSASGVVYQPRPHLLLGILCSSLNSTMPLGETLKSWCKARKEKTGCKKDWREDGGRENNQVNTVPCCDEFHSFSNKKILFFFFF